MPPVNTSSRVNPMANTTTDPPRCPTELDLERLGLHPYVLEPPDWRLPIQLNQPALGFPGLHPPHAGQQEDAITKSLVQGGFSARTLVGTESFSAHQMIYKKLSDDSGFNVSSAGLAALVEARRRYYAIRHYDTKSTIKVPGRVTLNDQKRENWLRELADPKVPLLKLSKNVPHGFKGEKLLEMLVQRRVDPARAVWYIQLIGLNEINAQRNKTDLMHVRYTLTFTSEVCQFLQKQLGEVTVPLQSSLSTTTSLITGSSRLAGMNVRSKLRSSTLSDPETRKNWLAKFVHSGQILKRLYADNLLDKPTLFKWFVDQLKLANLAQVHFLLDIHQMVVDKFCLSSNLVRAFVEACLAQIRFIAKQPPTPYLSKLDHRLRLAIQSSFISCADSFTWPDLWLPNRLLLEDILLSCTSSLDSPTEPFKQNISSAQVKEMLRNDFYTVDWRVSELVGEIGIGTGAPANTFTRRAQLVEILDGFSQYTDPSKLYHAYFVASITGDVTTFKDKIEVLLSWSTTPFRGLDDRIYLTCNTLICLKKDCKITSNDLQNHLITWLEQVETINDGDMLVRLFSELSKRNIFSYGAYIQKMVAKGDMEDDVMAGKASGLQTLLSEWMPLASTATMFRSRASQSKRSPGRDVARNSILGAFADITAALAAANFTTVAHVLHRQLDACHPNSASRKAVMEIMPSSLIRIVTELTSSPSRASTISTEESHPPVRMAAAILSWGIQIMEACKAYGTLCIVLHKLVQHMFERSEAHEQNTSIDRVRDSDSHIIQSRFCCLEVICVAMMNSRGVIELEGRVVDLISQLFGIYVRLQRASCPGAIDMRRSFVRSLRSLVIESRMMDDQILDVLNEHGCEPREAMPSNQSTAISSTSLAQESISLAQESTSLAQTSTSLAQESTSLAQESTSLAQELLHLLEFPSSEHASILFFKHYDAYASDPLWAPSAWNSLVSAFDTYIRKSSGVSPIAQQISSAQSRNWVDAWIPVKSTVLRFCEELDARSEGGLSYCLIQAGLLPFPHINVTSTLLSDSKMPSDSNGDGLSDGAADGPPLPPQAMSSMLLELSPALQTLFAALVSTGALSIELLLEELVAKPLMHLPQEMEQIVTCNVNPVGDKLNPAVAYGHIVARLSGMYDLIHLLLISGSPFAFKENSGDSLEKHHDNPNAAAATCGAPLRNSSDEDHGHIPVTINQLVETWNLKSERRRWLEQSDAGPAFVSRLLLTVLVTTKSLLDLEMSSVANTPAVESSDQGEINEKESSSSSAASNIYLKQITTRMECIRNCLCSNIPAIKRVIRFKADLMLDPILDFVDKNNLGSIFNTLLIRTVDELLPYSSPTDLVNTKYPYLESILKSTCIFTHAARVRQFQLHIRLLVSECPPKIKDDVAVEANGVLAQLVEVMARKLHLTDSKEGSPLFLSQLPSIVAEALVIKLSAYLGMSIFKLFAPTQQDQDYEISRIHHICRCISTLSKQLSAKTPYPNGDEILKSLGGTGQLACNATLDSYLSYWNQLKNGLTSFGSRFVENSYVSSVAGLQRVDSRIIRSLLHSIQVMLWTLPGLVPHLGAVKFSIVEVWVGIAMSTQAHPSLMTQIMDTIGILLFPTTPDDTSVTSAVGLMRKRFRWLHIPISHFEEGVHQLPMTRLKHILGSSLRGSTTTLQERVKDGVVKVLEEKPWEELEKMDDVGPGFMSIDSMKCQTLSQVEVVPKIKRWVKKNSRRASTHSMLMAGGNPTGSGEDTRTGERGEDEAEEDIEGEEDEDPAKGDRENFEHELNTDGLSTMPIHFLRSLYPSKVRLEGDYQHNETVNWLVTESSGDVREEVSPEDDDMLEKFDIADIKKGIWKPVSRRELVVDDEVLEEEKPRSPPVVRAVASTSGTRKRKIGQSELASVVDGEESILDPDSASHSGPTTRSTRSTRRKSSAVIAPPPNVPPTTKRGKKK